MARSTKIKRSNYTRVVVNRSKYYIRIVDSVDNSELLGLCDGTRKEISIRKKQSRAEIIKTILHELLHAIEYEYKLKIPHRLIYDLEAPLYKLLTSNKKILYNMTYGKKNNKLLL